MNNSENLMRQYQEAWSNHDIEKIRQLFHPQYSIISPDGTRKEGIQAGIENATMYLNAFPDLKLNLKNLYSSGDVAIAEFDAEGTQEGKLMDLNPTNRRVNVPVCDIIEVRDNKIYSEHEYFDLTTMLQQLGGKGWESAQA